MNGLPGQKLVVGSRNRVSRHDTELELAGAIFTVELVDPHAVQIEVTQQLLRESINCQSPRRPVGRPLMDGRYLVAALFGPGELELQLIARQETEAQSFGSS